MQDGKKQGDYCKLIQSLLPKKKYVLHYRNLQYYIKYVFVVDEIHIGLKFHQSDWIKLFIDTNTFLRAQATDEVSKSLFKLMNNSVYGKTVENVRERFKLDFVGNIRQAQRLILLPTYSRFSGCIISSYALSVSILYRKLSVSVKQRRARSPYSGFMYS